MHDQLRYLVIGSSLLLGACDVEDEYIDEESELGEPTPHGSMDEIQSGTEAEPRTMAGVDIECAREVAPVIMRIDPAVTECKFSGFEQNFGDTWTAVPLFLQGSPDLLSLVDAIPLHSPLREFCRYDYIGNASDPYGDYVDFVAYLRSSNAPPGVNGGSAATDCPVITPMTDEGLDTQQARDALHEAFMANIHAVSAEDLEGAPSHENMLVLLDTKAEGYAPLNPHGEQLESLIADIACPGDPETCLDWIEHVLVTPRSADAGYNSPNYRNGGNIGYIHDFSGGLAYAVLKWSQTNLALPVLERKRLVLSAAVGADPNHPIATDPTYAPAQSAIVALEAAYCLGATVYAAAGNTRDNSCPNDEEEMLAPAKWEERAVPTQAQCTGWGYTPDKAAFTYAPGTPLIQAVGGLDVVNDQPIGNHRRNAYPRLHAISSNAISSEGESAMTGTSVATAVAAATHLLFWRVQPNYAGNLVANRLYTTGYDTGEDADSGMYVNSDIRRLGVCHAMPIALGLSCGSLAPQANGNLNLFMGATEDAIQEAEIAGDLIEWEDSPLGALEPDCSEGPVFDEFVIPQPQRPACSNCSIIQNGGGPGIQQLNMSIANQPWAVNMEVTAAKLFTYNAAGEATYTDLSAVVPNINEAIPSNVIQVNVAVAVPASATLEFVYYDASSYTYTKQSNAIPLIQ